MRLFVVSALLVFSFPFIITEVVDSFSKCSQFFLDGKPLVIPGILNDSVSQDNNRYKLICQQYKNNYRFATLYNTTNKIPVFSAYTYRINTEFGKGRPKQRWMIEPQLESSGLQMHVRCVNQAYTGDYNNSNGLDRGHLFPSGHAVDKDTAKSTFTLTNVVPQYKSFNGGSWNRMENDVRKLMKEKCPDQNHPVYVLTGAVPSENSLKNKVNIPLYMWSAFCCYDKNTTVSWAYWAKNEDESRDERKTIVEKTLKELQQFFIDEYIPGIKLYPTDN